MIGLQLPPASGAFPWGAGSCTLLPEAESTLLDALIASKCLGTPTLGPKISTTGLYPALLSLKGHPLQQAAPRAAYSWCGSMGLSSLSAGVCLGELFIAAGGEARPAGCWAAAPLVPNA